MPTRSAFRFARALACWSPVNRRRCPTTHAASVWRVAAVGRSVSGHHSLLEPADGRRRAGTERRRSRPFGVRASAYACPLSVGFDVRTAGAPTQVSSAKPSSARSQAKVTSEPWTSTLTRSANTSPGAFKRRAAAVAVAASKLGLMAYRPLYRRTRGEQQTAIARGACGTSNAVSSRCSFRVNAILRPNTRQLLLWRDASVCQPRERRPCSPESKQVRRPKPAQTLAVGEDGEGAFPASGAVRLSAP
jgi:hypothetical protein